MTVLTIRTNLTYNSYKSVNFRIFPNMGINYSQHGNHTRNSLEGAEEGGFVGEARCQPYLWNLLVGFLHQLLGIRHTVGIDELHKRAVSLVVDAVGDVGAVRM